MTTPNSNAPRVPDTVHGLVRKQFAEDEAAREAGITYEAVRNIEADYGHGRTTHSRMIERLRELALPIIACRDHWKTAFEHERANVIRLRHIVADLHGTGCRCDDCQIVRVKAGSPT